MSALTSVTTAARFEQLRGRSQTDFVQKIPEHLARATWDERTLRAHQSGALRALLAHALEYSAFHARRLQGIDAATFAIEDLPSLPVMTKAEMMASYDTVVTDPRLSRARVEEQLAATGDRPDFLLDDYICLASGGSSGLRGVFVWHWQACSDFLLAVVRSALARVIEMGGPPPGGVSTAVVAAGSAVHATRAFTSIFSGDVFRISTISAAQPIDEIVRSLNELQPTMLIAYSMLLGLLAEEQAAGRLLIRPTSVTGTSELFTPELKARVGAAFGAAVIDSFGSSEGLIGTAPPGERAFNIASDLAIIELVDDAGRPVAPGVSAAKVLVTSLLNRAQPLIRYELTDRMVEQPRAPEHGHPRVTIEGRTDEIFVFGDVRLHPFVVRSVMTRTSAVSDFRVRQTAAGVSVEVVAPHRLDPASLERQLIAALTEAGLVRPTAVVMPVDYIDRSAETGKVRRFIPL